MSTDKQSMGSQAKSGTGKENDTVAETIAYARRTYKGSQNDVKPDNTTQRLFANKSHSNGLAKRLLNNLSTMFQSNRYGGSGA
jgi:hypothetical protein